MVDRKAAKYEYGRRVEDVSLEDTERRSQIQKEIEQELGVDSIDWSDGPTVTVRDPIDWSDGHTFM